MSTSDSPPPKGSSQCPADATCPFSRLIHQDDGQHLKSVAKQCPAFTKGNTVARAAAHRPRLLPSIDISFPCACPCATTRLSIFPSVRVGSKSLAPVHPNQSQTLPGPHESSRCIGKKRSRATLARCPDKLSIGPLFPFRRCVTTLSITCLHHAKLSLSLLLLDIHLSVELKQGTAKVHEKAHGLAFVQQVMHPAACAIHMHFLSPFPSLTSAITCLLPSLSLDKF